MVKQKLEKDKFDDWGRKLALAVQQMLVDKLPEELEPNVSLDTDGQRIVAPKVYVNGAWTAAPQAAGAGNFAYTVNVVIEKQHDRSHASSYSTAYIYADKLIVDPKDYGVGNVNNMTLDQAALTIAGCMAGNLNVTLEEGKLKNALAAGAVAAAALTGSTGGHPTYLSHDEHQSDVQRIGFKNFAKQHDARAKELAVVITDKYNISSDLALKIAKLALKHEKPVFPKAEDILAVCGIESSFKPKAVSQLKNDPAVGLMQVRPAVWKLDKAKLQGSIEEQIKAGADILHGYYVKLKSKESALHAYNIGITNYMQKKGLNPRYVPKFKSEREMYEGLVSGQARKVVLAVQTMFNEAFEDFDTDIKHSKTGARDVYTLTILAPFGQMWFEIDEEPDLPHGAANFQKIAFGKYNAIGKSTDETHDFHSEADALAFVKTAYNKNIKVKHLSNATIGHSGRKFDWQKYYLP